MNGIERFELIDLIGRELQSRMTFSDIDVYLHGFEVNFDKEISESNSKHVYVKYLLADASDEVIFQIADELEIDHGFVSSSGRDLSDSRFWIPGHFKLFLTHLASFKVNASALQSRLKPYGVSAFVAHEDIEPTKEWQDEIEKALLSMDALVAILIPDFHDSNWTDQEIGAAIGRDLLVIPIRHGLDPYGFIGKYQGFLATGLKVADVADALFGILSTHDKSRGTYAENLVQLFLLSNNQEENLQWLSLLYRFSSIPVRHLEKIRSNAPSKQTIVDDPVVLEQVNMLLKKYLLEPISPSVPTEVPSNDNIPF